MPNRARTVLIAVGVAVLGAALVGGALLARPRRDPGAASNVRAERPKPRSPEPQPQGPSAEERARSPLDVLVAEAMAALEGTQSPLNATSVIEGNRLPKRVELDALALALRRAELEAFKAFVVAHFGALADAEGPPSLAQYVIARWMLDAVVERRAEVELDLARVAIRMLKAGGERRQTVAALIPSVMKMPGLADPVAEVVRAVCAAKRDGAEESADASPLRCQAARALANSGSMGHAEALVEMATLFGDKPPIGDAFFAMGRFDEAMPYFLRVARVSDLPSRAVDAKYTRAMTESLTASGQPPERLLSFHEQEPSEAVKRFLLLAFLRMSPAGGLAGAESSEYVLRLANESTDAHVKGMASAYIFAHGAAETRINALKVSAERDKPGDFARNLAKACTPAGPEVQAALVAYARTLPKTHVEQFVRQVGIGAGLARTGAPGVGARPVLEAMRDVATDERLKSRIEGALRRIGR